MIKKILSVITSLMMKKILSVAAYLAAIVASLFIPAKDAGYAVTIVVVAIGFMALSTFVFRKNYIGRLIHGDD